MAEIAELVAEAALGRLLQSTPEEIALSVHPHPTVSEVLGEAALDLLGHAITSRSLPVNPYLGVADRP